MYSKLADVIFESGIWSGSRKESHAFLLSPDAYRITEAQRQELSALGCALNDCMLGLSHIAVIAYDQKLNYGAAWLLARRVFSTGVPSVYQELQGMNVRHIPKLLKVDLMVDREGTLKLPKSMATTNMDWDIQRSACDSATPCIQMKKSFPVP